MNSTNLIGRMTQDPELKILQNDDHVVRFTLAVQRLGSKTEATDFIDCVAWNAAADLICKHLVKGQQVGVTGPLRTHIYETSQGYKRKVTEVEVRAITFVGPPKDRLYPQSPTNFDRAAAADVEMPTESAAANGFTPIAEEPDFPL